MSKSKAAVYVAPRDDRTDAQVAADVARLMTLTPKEEAACERVRARRRAKDAEELAHMRVLLWNVEINYTGEQIEALLRRLVNVTVEYANEDVCLPSSKDATQLIITALNI